MLLWSLGAVYRCSMFSCSNSSPDAVYEDQMYLGSQSGTTRLDKFTHCLLVKCSVEVSHSHFDYARSNFPISRNPFLNVPLSCVKLSGCQMVLIETCIHDRCWTPYWRHWSGRCRMRQHRIAKRRLNKLPGDSSALLHESLSSSTSRWPLAPARGGGRVHIIIEKWPGANCIVSNGFLGQGLSRQY